MMANKSILVIDDDVHILHAAQLMLKRHFANVTIEKNVQQLPYLLNNYAFDIILLDMNFNRVNNDGKEGFHWLDFILDLLPKQKIILFTAYGDIEMAVMAIKLGAKDFVLKPWENEKLLNTINQCLDLEESSTSISNNIFIGACDEIIKVRQLLQQVATTDANILILGESGTGKDLLAKEIHHLSHRKEKTFVHADLGAISDGIFESELFGHVKGAFTDARADRLGLLQMADKGTLFLDEIGNLPLHLQSKLLFSLQNKNYIRVGSSKVHSFDARVISATNGEIYKMVEEKKFRQDLLYRINTIEIYLPPLRDRGDDILLLSNHFLKSYNKKYGKQIKSLSAAFEKKLMLHHWPGNVRELQHVIERAVIFTQGTVVKEEVIHFQSHAIAEVPNSFQLEEMEKSQITKALKKHNGNISDASQELGISRQALYRRIEKYKL
jgi:two-component system, NtrC family, response regulator HydG